MATYKQKTWRKNQEWRPVGHLEKTGGMGGKEKKKKKDDC